MQLIGLFLTSGTHLGHLHRVGQHLLQRSHRQGLLQDEGANGQIGRHILQSSGGGEVDHRHASVKGRRQRRHKVSSCLSVGRGFQEAEAVPEALAGETEFDLLLQDGGGALQNHLVILWTTHTKHSELLHLAKSRLTSIFFFQRFILFFVILCCAVSLSFSKGVLGYSRLNLIFSACIVCCLDLFWNEVAFFIRRAKGGGGGCSTL